MVFTGASRLGRPLLSIVYNRPYSVKVLDYLPLMHYLEHHLNQGHHNSCTIGVPLMTMACTSCTMVFKNARYS